MKDENIKKSIMFWTTQKIKKALIKKYGKYHITKALNEIIIKDLK